eukprot:scaffold412_cov388-Prasinococcus_capsulatus_cf.AAC.37
MHGFSSNRMPCAGGNLEVLQWVDEEYGLVLDEKLFAKSVCAGRIEALQWLRSQGYGTCPKGYPIYAG